jgi:hypothetical protein
MRLARPGRERITLTAARPLWLRRRKQPTLAVAGERLDLRFIRFGHARFA